MKQHAHNVFQILSICCWNERFCDLLIFLSNSLCFRDPNLLMSYTSKMSLLLLLVLWLALVWASISCDIVYYLSCGNAWSLFILLHALAWGQREMFHLTEELTLEVASGNQSRLCFFLLVLLTVAFLSFFFFLLVTCITLFISAVIKSAGCLVAGVCVCVCVLFHFSCPFC